MTGGPSWTKAANRIGQWAFNPIELVSDIATGSALANVNSSFAGRFIGAQMREEDIAKYKKLKKLENYGDRRAAQHALQDNYITLSPDGSMAVWGSQAAEVGQTPGTPVLDKHGKPILMKRHGQKGFQNVNNTAQHGWNIVGGANIINTLWTEIGERGETAKDDIIAPRGETAKDAIITPRGAVYTHPDDTIMAFKPGGPIMNSLYERGLYDDGFIAPNKSLHMWQNDVITPFSVNNPRTNEIVSSGLSKLEINGTLKLESNGQSVDLIDLVKSNPMAWREITEKVIIEASQNLYGRPKYAPQRYTIG